MANEQHSVVRSTGTEQADPRSSTASLAYRTADLPGVGGVIKQRQEDFVVEEQPLYEAAGRGEHLMLCIEKRGMTTSDAVRRLAKLFRVRRSDIGYAGLKDKHAVTRQHLSVYLPRSNEDEALLARIEHTPMKLLWAKRHQNKLRRGHHAGNRFDIRIRDADMAHGVERARAVLEVLERHGCPNYLGDQRFGYRQTNDAIGALLVRGRWQAALDLMLGGARSDDPPVMQRARNAYDRGDYADALELWSRQLRHDRQALDALRQGRSAEQAVRAIDPQQREFLLTSLQSAVFNEVVDRRLCAGLLDRLVEGDLAWKHDNRAVFAVDAATAELENSAAGRVGRLEVSPSGPMWGRDMTQPTGQPLAWEIEALESFGLSVEAIAASPLPMPGARRPMRMTVRNPQVEGGADDTGPYLRIAFELPRGSFATVVLREVMKPCIAASRAPADAETGS